MAHPPRDLTGQLRDRLIGGLHIGDLAPGDRLPSIRQVARAADEDPRRVARAYRALEAEGLVEVRGRSGVYVAPPSRLADGMLEETAEWLARVLLDGWTRRITVPLLPEVLRRYSARVPVRCAFLDSCEDAMVAFGHEIEHELGMAVSSVWIDTLPPLNAPVARFPAELREAQVIATTVFCASRAREVAGRLDRPLATVRIHPQAAATVSGKLKRGSLTVVCVDPSFGERIRLQYARHAAAPDRIRVVLADDRDALERVDPAEPVLLTRAARRRVRHARFRMLMPHAPTLSPESAHELLRCLVRAHTNDDEASAPLRV